MKNIPLFFLLVGPSCFAQPRPILEISGKVSSGRLKDNVYYLSSDKMEGRLMASHGDTLTSLFIADWFQKNNLTAPYDSGKNYFQPITARKKISTMETLTIKGRNFLRWDGWGIIDMENINRSDMAVVFAGYGLSDSLYDDLKNIDVRDKAVIILPRQPRRNQNDSSLKFSKSTKFSPKIAALKEKGASLILYYDSIFPEEAGKNKKLDSTAWQYISQNSLVYPLPVIIISEERTNELLSANKTSITYLQDSINKNLQPASFDLQEKLSIDIALHIEEVHPPNVIGIIYGSDPGSRNIIVTAHHDHIGKHGNDIYHGASDNASGTVALMEIAALMNDAVNKGLRPKHNIVFISTTGEEGGNLGSAFYAAHPLFPVEETIADVNLDLLGRIDDGHSNKTDSDDYVYALIKDSKENHITGALENANKDLSLKINRNYNNIPTDIMLKGWDTDSFMQKNIPCISFFTGATKDALQTTDTADKIDYKLLTNQTKLAFLTLWNLANQ